MTNDSQAQSKHCSNCKETIHVGDRYLSWGGFCWCDLDCVAEFQVEKDAEFRDETTRTAEYYELTDEKMADIEENHEWKTLTAE